MNCSTLTPQTLEALQGQAFDYFLHEVNLENGLVADNTDENAPASITAVGLALATFPVAVERAFFTRAEAVERTLTTLRFFNNSAQGPQVDATGYQGFYYHLLDKKTGQRSAQCELSTIDSAFLLAGMLTAAAYFTNDSKDEDEIRTLAEKLYGRTDWTWAQNGAAAMAQSWKPESGFSPSRWQGYNEALLMYLLGLGSPTHSLPEESYAAWTSTYQWKKVFDHELLYSGPLFTHQLSHMWVDFRGIQDAYMRSKCIDYFENSRRATYTQQEYAIRNPGQFEGYGEHCWGITASEGPGEATLRIQGKKRQFYGYLARGVPDGPDDGTLAPWCVAASLPFAPEIVLPTLQHFEDLKLRAANPYGFKTTFNATFPEKNGPFPFWVSPRHLALNQGPIVLMVENFRSGLIWRLMRQCPHLVRGLRRAGFTEGWLGSYSRIEESTLVSI